MPNKTLPLLSALLVSSTVLAQAPTASLGLTTDVQGLVTMSDGTTVGSVLNGSPVVDGSRLVTGSNGSATLKFNDGCEVKLKPNQSMAVRDGMSCEARIASALPLPGSLPGGAQVFAGLGTGPLMGLTLLASAAVLRRAASSDPTAASNPLASGQ